jgi:excisionase family DNA binding protein
LSIGEAKRRDDEEVRADDVLIGCLQVLSRFGIVRLGHAVIDLQPLGVRWDEALARGGTKVAYSADVVELLDRAASIARADRRVVGVEHILAAFTGRSDGLMGKLVAEHGFTSASWRAALSEIEPVRSDSSRTQDADGTQTRGATREFMSPEEAADWLGVHIQTIRGYIRSGKLPALRLAGERAIRIRRDSLERLLEPLTPTE